jgi:uncharacterized protein (TIGR03083 family)
VITTIGDVAGTDIPQGDRINVDLDPAATLAAYARHRRRFALEVGSLDEAALAVQSRCSEWSVADVLRHGCDVDGWMRAIWAGEALPFTSFDPRTTPKEFVLAGRVIPDAEVRDRYAASAETMAADVGTSGSERWGLTSISPLGFVPWWQSALHVFYDSWVHERDALLPLGAAIPVVADEAVPILAYSLAVAGTLIKEPTDTFIAGVHLMTGEGPAIATPVTTGADTDGDVASIIDALSGRGIVEDALAGTDPDVVHRVGALARWLQP